MPDSYGYRGKIVLDMVLCGTSTPLLRRVGRGGGLGMDGTMMWAIQGALQLRALIGMVIPSAELRARAREALQAAPRAAGI